MTPEFKPLDDRVHPNETEPPLKLRNFDDADTPPVLREEDPDLEAKLDALFADPIDPPSSSELDDF